MNSYAEPSRELPVVGCFDVVVCGGGPAGIAAALAAARAGARTALLEVHGCLGGVWTAGLLAWVLDSTNKSGIMAEILARLEVLQARQPAHFSGVAFDVEAMKLVLEEMCLEAGVHLRLHCRVTAAARDHNNRLAVAITESKSGREAWAAHCFVDATGDGDFAAQAGCGFDFGHPETKQTQPMSLLCLLSGIDDKEIRPFLHIAENPGRADSREFLRVWETQGVRPSYGLPSLFKIHDSLFMLMANHEYGVSGLDAQQITEATLHARREVHVLINALRASGGGWRNVHIVATGAQIGVREGRRIHGRYTVSAADLVAGARHDDAVCRVTFQVDVHTTDREKGDSFSNEGVVAKHYDIPLRALIARDVDGLLLAGRCISGDFIAHSSYRVTGNAVALGEAAGITAATAAGTGRLPHQVEWKELGLSPLN